MSGKLVEFPRRLEWQHTDCWYGKVKGTNLHAKVETGFYDGGFSWLAWDDRVLIGSGMEADDKSAMEKAKEALENGVVVVRPMPTG